MKVLLLQLTLLGTHKTNAKLPAMTSNGASLPANVARNAWNPAQMERETARRDRENKSTLFVTIKPNVRSFLGWLQQENGVEGTVSIQGNKLALVLAKPTSNLLYRCIGQSIQARVCLVTPKACPKIGARGTS